MILTFAFILKVSGNPGDFFLNEIGIENPIQILSSKFPRAKREIIIFVRLLATIIVQ
jgi:hypothetical protein